MPPEPVSTEFPTPPSGSPSQPSPSGTPADPPPSPSPSGSGNGEDDEDDEFPLLLVAAAAGGVVAFSLLLGLFLLGRRNSRNKRKRRNQRRTLANEQQKPVFGSAEPELRTQFKPQETASLELWETGESLQQPTKNPAYQSKMRSKPSFPESPRPGSKGSAGRHTQRRRVMRNDRVNSTDSSGVAAPKKEYLEKITTSEMRQSIFRPSKQYLKKAMKRDKEVAVKKSRFIEPVELDDDEL